MCWSTEHWIICESKNSLQDEVFRDQSWYVPFFQALYIFTQEASVSWECTAPQKPLARTSALINQNWNDITLFPVNPITTTDLFELQHSNVVSWRFCCWLMDWTEKCWKGQCNSCNSPLLFCQIGFKKKSWSYQTMLANYLYCLPEL